MQRIFIVLTVLALPACYNITFDSLEYDRYVDIKQHTDNSIPSCGTPAAVDQVKELKRIVDHQTIYSSNRTNRPHVARASQELRDIVDGLYASYQTGTPSVVYCKEKLNNISEGTSSILNEIGSFQ